MKKFLFGALTLALCACSSEPTQVIVAVDTDFAIPSEIDTIYFEVTAPDGRMQTSSATLADVTDDGVPRLPRTLALTRQDGALGPYEVRVTGRRSGGEVIERRARVSFLEDRSVLLLLHLLRACRTAGCSTEQTCDIEGCRSVDVDPSELVDWTGRPERLDAGMPIDMNAPLDLGDTDTSVPDACSSVVEVCNGADDNCDGRMDEGFDLLNDVDNCGECDHACPALPLGAGTRSCVNGQCRALCVGLDSADCNQLYGDGCEAPLDSPQSCGSCLTMCMLQHATPGCAVDMSSAMCSISACAFGYDDCDANPRNGCETNINTDVNHCGSCAGTGHDCEDAPDNGTSRCMMGECVIDCDPGYEDCDGRADTGCEANMNDPETCGACGVTCPVETPFCEGSVLTGFECVLNCTVGEVCGSSCVDTTSNPQHCSACNMACPSGSHSQPRCTDSTCGLACDTGFDNCNGMASDGCEQNVRIPAHCGMCNNACDLPNVAEYTCSTGSCGIALCSAGFEDCNDVAEDGCEVDTRSNTGHCGMCDRACEADPTYADSVCVMGMCQLVCDPGYQDCGPASGCETLLSSPLNCGACGNACTGADSVCQASSTGVDGSEGDYSCVSVCGGGNNHLCGASCVDTSVDPANCNMCGQVCPPRAHAVATCAMGVCGSTCDMNYGNCNPSAGDGCETNLLTDVDHCGSCPAVCPEVANAERTCASGICGFHCDAGYGDCSTGIDDGCETQTNTIMNCGSCGNSCPTTGTHVASATCEGGDTCALVCTGPNFADCDGMLDNGCEAAFLTDTDHCGDCDTACGTGENCCEGSCCAGLCVAGLCVGG